MITINKGKHRSKNNFLVVLVCCALLVMVGNGFGQDHATELAKKTQNPVSDLLFFDGVRK